jgi:hypothetical protein
MIPQLDINDFLKNGIFVFVFFLVFIYMIRVVFIVPIEKYICEYRTELNILKLQQLIYSRKNEFVKQEEIQLEIEMAEEIGECHRTLFEKNKVELLAFEEELLDNLNNKIKNSHEKLSTQYDKETVTKEIVDLFNQENRREKS